VLPGGDVGCLLIHGFTGTPYEMRFVGEHLNAAGYTVSGVRLAGHTTRVEDLAQFARGDWYASVNEGFDVLMGRCRQCVVVGLSLGSLLALRLAIDRPEAIGGLVLLSSALVLTNPWPARVGRLLRPLVPWLPHRWQYVRKGASDIADEAARAIHPGYRAMPLRGILELVALQREVRQVLPLVQQPALIIHSAQDHTAPLVNMTVLQQSLPSVRRTVVLERSFHVLTVDAEKDLVAQEIAQFVADTVGVPQDLDFP
jgi:carboxylesterase